MAQDEDPDRPQREFDEGIQQISAALVDAARAADLVATSENIRLDPPWKRGNSIPSALRMTLAPPGAPVMLVNLSREQIEDCWNGLDRPEVRQIMREVTNRYRKMQGK